MASKFLNKRSVPNGFREILSELTKEILREQPADIVHFAASYFEHLSRNPSSAFIYDKNAVIKGTDNKQSLLRGNTSNSHKSEKNLAKEYISQLYEFGIEKLEDLDMEAEKQDFLGELYINIMSAKELRSKETNEDTYCVAFLSSDPLKIIKTPLSNEPINPEWNHQDKIVLRNLSENDLYETFLIFQVYTNDNGKILVGEYKVDVYFAITNPGEWELILNHPDAGDSEVSYGFLNLQVNFLKDNENENNDAENEAEDEEEKSYHESEDN